MGKRFYKFASAIIRTFSHRMTTEWEVPFEEGPCVFVANHVGAIGPVDMCTKFPMRERCHPWINNGMLEAKEVPAYVRQDYWWKPGNIFEPLLNVTEFIVDQDGNELPPGVVGELYIGGMGVASGYNDLPEMKEEQRNAIVEGRTAFVVTLSMGGPHNQRPGRGQTKSVDMSAYRAVDTCSMVFEGFEWTYTLYGRIADQESR